MKKLFTNDKFFLAMVLCAVIGEGAYALGEIIFDFGHALQPQLTLMFRVICVIALYLSYQKHSKNVMKGMMGALLAAQLLNAISILSESVFSADYVCLPLFVAFSLLLFINHFIINANRKASSGMIKLNQILALLLFVNNTVWCVFWMVMTPTPLCVAMEITDIIGFLGMTASIVCVESRLDAYRLGREAAGWTEEAGYPKGYVHEWEKK